MPVWMTTTGAHGSIQVIPDEKVLLKNGGTKLIPGLRLSLQRAWVTGDIDMGLNEQPEFASGEFTKQAPEFYDTDHMPPGDVGNLRKAAAHREDMKKNPVKWLEQWFDGEDAKQYYGLQRGDPRGKRPVRMTMTADDYKKFVAMKSETGLDTKEVITQPPVSTPAQQVHQGTRVTR